LKLKTTEYIPSDFDEYDPTDFKKIILNNNMINKFVDNLWKKKMKRSDVKLLEITGFGKVVEILNKQKAVERM
jgi:hypothetical protein